MSFVRDVTIGEGESVPPDTPFTKTWRIQNTGKTARIILIIHSADQFVEKYLHKSCSVQHSDLFVVQVLSRGLPGSV